MPNAKLATLAIMAGWRRVHLQGRRIERGKGAFHIGLLLSQLFVVACWIYCRDRQGGSSSLNIKIGKKTFIHRRLAGAVQYERPWFMKAVAGEAIGKRLSRRRGEATAIVCTAH